MDDGDLLLQRCREGDASALPALVRLYQGPIFRLACRVLGDAARAEEATADALAKVWARCGQWRGEARASTWIYQVAIRAVLDCRRRRRRWLRFGVSLEEAELLDPQPGPAEEVAEQERHEWVGQRLQAALRQLAEPDRVLVHLYYYEQRGLAEIEAILGVARATLKTRLARARQRLRTLLGDGHELL